MLVKGRYGPVCSRLNIKINYDVTLLAIAGTVHEQSVKRRFQRIS